MGKKLSDKLCRECGEKMDNEYIRLFRAALKKKGYTVKDPPVCAVCLHQYLEEAGVAKQVGL